MNIIVDIARDVRSIILPMFGRGIPLAVLETLEALWPEERRPQVHARKKTENGYTFTIALPPGISFKDFYSKLDYFKDAAGGNKVNATITQSGKMIILKITTNLLKNYYDYPENYPRNGILPVPIGYSTDGLQVIDIATLPHLLIGGTTGAGKSNIIHVIANSLLSLPEPPLIVLIDLKMSEYNYLEDRILLVTEQEAAAQCLDRLAQEMRQRQRILKQSRCVDIKKYRQHGGAMQYIILIIDEVAELREKDAQEDMETLLRLCRASGINIVAATQRPSSKIFGNKGFGDAKANFSGTLCFRTKSEVDSRVIMDTGEASGLPKIPGRAYLRIGCDLMEIQTPYLDPEGIIYADQFSPHGVSKEFPVDRDITGMGSIGHATNPIASLPFFKGCTAKIKSIIGKGKNP